MPSFVLTMVMTQLVHVLALQYLHECRGTQWVMGGSPCTRIIVDKDGKTQCHSSVTQLPYIVDEEGSVEIQHTCGIELVTEVYVTNKVVILYEREKK